MLFSQDSGQAPCFFQRSLERSGNSPPKAFLIQVLHLFCTIPLFPQCQILLVLISCIYLVMWTWKSPGFVPGSPLLRTRKSLFVDPEVLFIVRFAHIVLWISVCT